MLCGTELLVVAQSFAFAVFATLICQINSVFPCKDTKRYSAGAEFLDSLLLVCGTELCLWHRALLLRLETHILPIAVCKSTRIRLVPNSWIVCFWLWHRALVVAQSLGLWHRAWGCGTELCFCRLCNFDLPNKQRFSLQRHKSVIRLVPNSWIVCFACSTELGFVAQSFAFAVFATLICQINIVFPCKDTKAQNRLCAGKYLETC